MPLFDPVKYRANRLCIGWLFVPGSQSLAALSLARRGVSARLLQRHGGSSVVAVSEVGVLHEVQLVDGVDAAVVLHHVQRLRS